MRKNVKKYLGEILLVFSSLAFAFEWYFIRNIFDSGFSTFDIIFIRAAGSLLILLIILPLFIRKFFHFEKVSRSDLKYFMLLGFITTTVHIFFNLALKYTTVANTLIILYLSVFWSIILGFIFLKEKSSIKKIFSFN